MKTKIQQAPIRNTNIICESVYSHSGEFSPVATDLELSGRGLDFKFIRSYRSSLTGQIGDLGRGWSSSVAKKIESEGDDIVFHNGAGEVFLFTSDGNGTYKSPTGFYGILSQENEQFLIRYRYGLKNWFEAPESGGKILRAEDKNQNSIQFSYYETAIVIIDSLKRKLEIEINKGLLQELRDHAGRSWKYLYDKNHCLIEVTQPGTADFPNGTSIKYAYDTKRRLISITDAKGQKYLVNSYDKYGRVITQEHGSGVFKVKYDSIGNNQNGYPIYRTTCTRKNGSTLVLEHNEVGNVLSRTISVSNKSFLPEDITGLGGNAVPLTTRSIYNKNSELISRIFPAGNRTKWLYSEDEKDSLNQGNLLQFVEIPQAGVESDQEKIVTEFQYESSFQLRTKLSDPRGNETSYEYDNQGNLVRTTYPSVTIQPVNNGTQRPNPVNKIQQEEYQYNSMGQLLRKIHIDGTITEYFYYPVEDPIGTNGPNTATNNPASFCGYLARVVRDASGKKVKTEYAYDHFGNATTIWDGKSNPARLRYNAIGKLENVTSREPYKNSIEYKYDANYNEIESIQAFERFVYDENTQNTIIRSSILRELKEYNALNNVVLRKIVGGDKVISEFFIRDANENIIRQIQPLGNLTEYSYDERDLLVEKNFAVGTREAFTNQFTYSLNGSIRSFTDGNGQITTHHYDGFNRYKGFSNPIGTKKSQTFDEAGNVVRVEINRDNVLGLEESNNAPFVQANYHFDQWNRVYRVDKTWIDSDSQSLGQSKWDGGKGIVSSLVEYSENGLTGKVWTESDNVLAAEYDGVGRIVTMIDMTGEEFTFDYDENNNVTLMRYIGPEVQGGRCERVFRRRYDEMDRLIWQQENEEAPEKFQHNELGNVINYVAKSGLEIHHIDDVLGRRIGHVYTVTDALNTNKGQKIARLLEYDDNYRLTAFTDAAGNRTAYRYDTLDRQTGILFPNGEVTNIDYDANGNIIREIDQNKNEINNRYDALSRLIERQSLIKNTDQEIVERFEYDGLNRLIATVTQDAVVQRTYDSLSRLLTEQQGEHIVRYTHDSMGNPTRIVYPGGEEVHKTYDNRNRVTSVSNRAGETIASLSYRANDQIARMFLGKVIEADFSYDQQQRLAALEYRRTDNQSLVDGFRYQYDGTGKITHEIQLSESSTYGERYYYDNANRPTKAQYGVKDVFDPISTFEQETFYEHFQEGSWQRRIDLDGQGHILDEKVGTTNSLNKYKNFGNIYFDYDANGNCILKGTLNPGYCNYTYDQHNRLIRSECYDAQGNKTQTIEYFYDSLGRQIRKVLTDQNGKITDYTYVWAGNILIEEYENGVLVRTYIYSAESLPVQILVNNNGAQSSYYFTLNGKGLASGLLHTRDPNAFAEKYGYELTGASYMKEINGEIIPIPSRSNARSGLGNTILSVDYMKDWANNSLSGVGGIHVTPEIAAVLNGFGKGYSGGSAGAMGRQTHGYLDLFGLGGAGQGSTAGRTMGGRGNKDGLPAGSNNPNDTSLYSSTDSQDVGIGWMYAVLAGVATVGAAAALVATPVGWAAIGFVAASSAFALATAQAAKLQNQYNAEVKQEVEKEAEEKAKSEKEKEEKEKKEKEEKEKEKDPQEYVTPEVDNGNGAITHPTLHQVEAKLMSNKTPTNPNGGPGTPDIDTSSLPPRAAGGLDPTIVHIEGEIGSGGSSNTSNPLMGGGFTDPGRPDLTPQPMGTPNTDGGNNSPWVH